MGRKILKRKKYPRAGPVSPESLRKIKVGKIMNRRPATVNSDTSIEGLIERLRGQIEDCFPVITKNRRLVGVVTESDVLDIFKMPARHALFGASMAKQVRKGVATHVGEIMTRHPIVATPDMAVSEVIKLMTAHKLRHLPVVKDDRLVGLITLRHIMDLYHMVKR